MAFDSKHDGQSSSKGEDCIQKIVSNLQVVGTLIPLSEQNRFIDSDPL